MVSGRIKLSELYADCGCNEHEVFKLADMPDDMESVLNTFLKSIHDGTLTPGQVDDGYYHHVADQLKSGVAKGLGGAQFGADDYRNTLKAYLDQNVYAFSGARSLYMMEQYRSFLTDATGKLLSESAFISKVADLSEIDNVTHLKAERNSAIASAQMAEKWQGLQAFPALEYRTVGDDRVRPEHAILDGLILAADDPKWSTIYPPNAWNCRCTVIPADTGAVVTPDDTAIGRVKNADIQPYFKRNVGKEKLVYSDDHPYIQKVGIDKLTSLDAEKNYGMQSGEKIYDNGGLPTFEPLPDKVAANTWWHDIAGKQRGQFDVVSADGLTVTFDNEFRNHVFEQNSDDRFLFIKEVKTLLQSPDEIWSSRAKGVINNLYIKYFEGAPMVLVVNAEDSVKAVTIYEVKKAGSINFKALKNMRKGTLKYKSR